MDQATLDRLFNWRTALDHPVTKELLVFVAAALVAAILTTVLLGRAGRLSADLRKDLRERIRSWLILIPIMVIPVLAGAAWTILGVGLLSLLCYREFSLATGLFREKLVSVLVVLGIAAITFATFDNWYGFFVALPSLTLCALAAVVVGQDRPKGYIQRVGLGVFAFMLFGVGLGHLGFFANDRLYRPVILSLLVCVQMNDVFAYCVGKSVGGPKLAPHTSPNKTISGALGALVLTTGLTSLLMHQVFAGTEVGAWGHCLALGLLVSVAGQMGDLVVSSIKRDVGIKDMGAVLAGHGGVLDRFNSVLLMSPAVFHYVGYIQGVGLDQPRRILTGG
ncbi:MAG: phosphatidate cytidylyltransferase [Phycisphaeraceae bacterium]|nr:phosphatidate cytidylyltransferase [Phycisphaeraceae bacterium]